MTTHRHARLDPPRVELDPRRWWALAVLAASLLVVVMDMTILNVALPEMAAELHLSSVSQLWVVDAYALALAGLLIPVTALGDRWGRKRMLLPGLRRLRRRLDRHPLGGQRRRRHRDPCSARDRGRNGDALDAVADPRRLRRRPRAHARPAASGVPRPPSVRPSDRGRRCPAGAVQLARRLPGQRAADGGRDRGCRVAASGEPVGPPRPHRPRRGAAVGRRHDGVRLRRQAAGQARPRLSPPSCCLRWASGCWPPSPAKALTSDRPMLDVRLFAEPVLRRRRGGAGQQCRDGRGALRGQSVAAAGRGWSRWRRASRCCRWRSARWSRRPSRPRWLSGPARASCCPVACSCSRSGSGCSPSCRRRTSGSRWPSASSGSAPRPWAWAPPSSWARPPTTRPARRGGRGDHLRARRHPGHHLPGQPRRRGLPSRAACRRGRRRARVRRGRRRRTVVHRGRRRVRHRLRLGRGGRGRARRRVGVASGGWCRPTSPWTTPTTDGLATPT